jgi:hypothetical protein
MAHGHAPEQAEAYARRLPAYADADPSHVDAFARANVQAWNEIAESNGSAWVTTMAQTAREWAGVRPGGNLGRRRNAGIQVTPASRAGNAGHVGGFRRST